MCTAIKKPGFALPVTIIAKREENIFLAQKKTSGEKNSLKKLAPKNAILLPINKLNYLSKISGWSINPLWKYLSIAPHQVRGMMQKPNSAAIALC